MTGGIPTKFAYIAAVVIATPALAQVTVPVGVRVPVSTTAELSSQNTKNGQKLTFTVDSDIVVGGRVIVTKGATALGTVSDVQKPGRSGKSGVLTLTVDSVLAVDNQYLALMTVPEDTAAQKGDSAGGARQSSASHLADQVPGVGAAKGVMGMFHRGDDVVYPAHSIFLAETALHGTVNIKDGSPPAATPQTASGDSAQASGLSPATAAFFEAAQVCDMALGAYAAALGSSPAVRAFGRGVVAEDSALLAQLHALAKERNIPVTPVGGDEQGRLNTLLKSIRQEKGVTFDHTLLQQMYAFEQEFVEGIPDGDESPMGQLLAKTSKTWTDHMIQGAKLFARPAGTAPTHRR